MSKLTQFIPMPLVGRSDSYTLDASIPSSMRPSCSMVASDRCCLALRIRKTPWAVGKGKVFWGSSIRPSLLKGALLAPSITLCPLFLYHLYLNSPRVCNVHCHPISRPRILRSHHQDFHVAQTADEFGSSTGPSFTRNNNLFVWSNSLRW